METTLSSLSHLASNLTPTTVVSTTLDGSPRAVAIDTGGNMEPLAAVPDAKLRLMCSFGGHIMPRPHDKALTYSSGETRLVVIDRRASLASLRSRLSSMLLNGRSFTLKYQLPSEDLDSLVSITTDEDLENMIEEYDRATSSATATATHRIRLFLFANKLETAATMGSLLDSAKSETWFVNALNQSGLLPRGLSDSAAVNNTLVNLDEAGEGEAEVQKLGADAGCVNSKQGGYITNGVISHQEMHMSSMPDSPMMEAAGGSSIGSSSSSPSTAYLPPIRVRVGEDQRMEQQFAQMSFSNVDGQRNQEDGAGLMANRPMMIPPGTMTDTAVGYSNAPTDAAPPAISHGRVAADDDRSDPGVVNGYRKPPLPMQPVAIPQRGAGGYGLTSPDSVASDTSISSATSFSKPVYYQDQAPTMPRAPVTQPEITPVQTSHCIPQHETTSAQTTSHVLSQPTTYTTMDQQHQVPVQQPFLHQGVQYIPHPSQYIPVYPHHQQQQNYPVYVMSVPQSQQYVPAGTPPLYPNSTPTTNPRPEVAQNVYPAPISHNPQVQQQQPQLHYMGYAGGSQQTANANPNYSTGAYEYTNPQNETMYYHAQRLPTNSAIPLASPYQSMTPAAAAAALADMSKQMSLASDKEQQQHITASQPL
ncbi:Octicosapeptide/Phox/Bem1p family protein [Raphanus sativus]|uniref:Uncharacterized protein LOC130496245 n=1 Tax=Raphanus sativus TaxID=3726 RepID=A0A9W3BY07_RAPSA|nr:uncharacterized protein LOC130496245 [Raphanus sativus]KAJ4886853.1 Octicosapeptide/Phox/Bem1p family protein [Raphanus sativus]